MLRDLSENKKYISFVTSFHQMQRVKACFVVVELGKVCF